MPDSEVWANYCGMHLLRIHSLPELPPEFERAPGVILWGQAGKTPSVAAAVGRGGAVAAGLIRGIRRVPVGGIALPGVAPGRVGALVVVAVAVAVLNAVVAPRAPTPATGAKPH